MLKTIKQHLKSKTVNFNLMIAVVGVLELNFHYLKSALGDSYGVCFVVVSVVGVILRKVTTKPLEAK